MRFFFLQILFLLFSNFLFCQTLRFEHPTDESHFLRGTVLDLIQDQQGFIWVATTNGLGRYDGENVVEYRNVRGDSTSLSNNYTSKLYEDKTGKIWIATKSGLNCYLPEQDKFIRYFDFSSENFESSNYILDVIVDRKGFVWYTTYDGAFRLDPEKNKTIHFVDNPENENSFSHKIAFSVFEDSKGRLWFGTRNGITFYKNDDSFLFKKILPNEGDSQELTTERVFSFTEQSNGNIWIGTDYGFFRVCEKGEKIFFKQYKHNPKDENSLSYDFVESIWAEGNEKLWVSTWAGGLNEVILPKQEEGELQFIHHKNNPNVDYSLKVNRVHKTLKDRSGILWVGTTSGLAKASNASWKFERISKLKNNPNSISNNIIKSILKDSKGNLWIGTYDGLNFLSSEDFKNKNFEFKKFRNNKNDPNSISHNNIFSLEEDSLGFLWIGTYRGLNYINLNESLDQLVFKKIKFKNGIPHTWIYNTLEIEKGKYWIATYGKMAKMFFDPRENKKPKFEVHDMDKESTDSLVNATTYQFCKDKNGDYWVGTFLGLSKYVNDKGKVRFENYKNIFSDTMSLSNNSIVTLFKDSKGRLWIGTRNGLNLVVQNSKKLKTSFQTFGTRNGFPSDLIRAIEEDENGFLWVSTSNGLVHFNPNAAIENKPSVIKIYNDEDGLLSRAFVFRSSFKDDEGNLYFGTANGLNHFNPSQLAENQNVAPVVLTNLKVLNKKINPSDDENSILKNSISKTDTLVLTHQQNIIEIEFAGLDFLNAKKNQYQYQLEGVNEKWVSNGSNNKATFTNIPIGDNLFKVKGSNNDGIWNNVPTKLLIRVLPPWWRTWWAYVIYFSLFVFSIYSFIKWRIYQRIHKIKEQTKIQAARFEEREILRKKNAADFHDELGHRLTKISLFLELAEREANGNSSLKTFFSKIKSNAGGLSEGISDMIWSLDPKKDSLNQTIIRLQEFGDRLFDFSKVKYKTSEIENDFEKIKIDSDVRKHILLIFKEAMNNSLKYSKAENTTLETSSFNDHISITFKDDGVGFDLLKNRKGYGLKNIQDRANKINGKIIIDSKPNEGTSIQLIIKKENHPFGVGQNQKRTINL